MADHNRDRLDVKKQGWEKTIPVGWKLASVTDARRKSSLINNNFKNDLEKPDYKIHLSDGYWDRKGAHAGTPIVMDVLISGKDPEPAMFKTIECGKLIKDIPSAWRLACVKEVRANLDTVRDTLQKGNVNYANLCDGHVTSDAELSNTKQGKAQHYLLIQIAKELVW